MHVTNLKPDVLLGQGTRGIVDDVPKALSVQTIVSVGTSLDLGRWGAHLETLLIFGLLLVDDAETKVDLVGLLEVGLHAHDLGEGLLGQLERAETIVEDADAVP